MTILLLLFVGLDVFNNASTLRKIRPFIYASLALLVVAIVFKLLHWAGGNILLLISHAGIALSYIIQLFIRSKKHSEEYARTVFVVLLCAASLTRALHWKFNNELVLLAAAAFIIYFGIVGVKYLRSRRKKV